jgi:3-methyladenine DNA glycosylase AlkD
MKNFEALFEAMHEACDPRRQKCLAAYFDTGSNATRTKSPFYGLTAVAARKVALRFADEFRPSDLRRLLASGVNEHRFVALEVLVRRYETGSPAERKQIAEIYLRNLRHVDHWVLVDTSAPYILGDHLSTKRRTILFELASSKKPMMRRIAIVATAAFIRANDFDDTLRIAERLLHDDDPLIHRAVGWMLREVGKRSQVVATRFLDRHFGAMPRLMLRYALEQLPAAHRKRYLKKSV